MKYYTKFKVKVSHPYAFDDQLFNLTIKERLPLCAVRMVLKEVLHSPCYHITVRPKHSSVATHSCSSIKEAVAYVRTIRLHRNAINYETVRVPELLVKFKDTQFICCQSQYNGQWFTFFKPYDEIHPISMKAIQEIIDIPVGISVYGDPYVKGYYNWFSHLNDETGHFETWFGKTEFKTVEKQTVEEL